MAQPITHVVGGALVAQTAITLEFVPHSTLKEVVIVWIFALVGAFIPDSVMVPEFIVDKLKGKQAMTNQGNGLLEMTDFSHSIPIWASITFFCWLYWHIFPNNVYVSITFLFVYSGLIVGVMFDVPTHSEERFKVTDVTFLYPYNEKFQKLFGVRAIRWQHDGWEYRYNHGVIWPLNVRCLKPWEVSLNEIFIMVVFFEICLY